MFESLIPDAEQSEDPTFLYRKEQRVTSAITTSELNFFLETGKCAEPLNVWLNKNAKDYDINETLNYQQFWFESVDSNYVNTSPIPQKILRALEQCANISQFVWSRVHTKYSLVWMNGLGVLLKYWNLRIEYTKVLKDLQNSPNSIIESKYYRNLGLNVSCCADYVMFVNRNNRKIILPWLALVAIQDSIIGILDSLMYAAISDRYLSTDMYRDTCRFIQAGVSSSIKLGVKVYSVLKNLHPWAVGAILDHEHSGYVNNLRRVVEDDIDPCALRDLYLELMISTRGSLLALQFSGLSKIFTYPIVSIDGAVKNVLERGTIWRPNTYKHAHKATSMFKKIIAREYLRIHHTWPPHKIVGPVPGEILASIESNSWGERGGNWHPDDFKNITFEKFLDLDWFPDSSELLSDKAICVGIDSWPREYDIRYHTIKYGRRCNPGKKVPKRAIIKHLTEESVDTHDMVLKALNLIKEARLCFVMCIKEKELNQAKARYFTKLPFEMRIMQNLIENGAKMIMKYFPQQSMTMGSLSLEKFKLRSSNKVIMTISLDFVKWCLNQRHEINVDTTEEMDRIFGLLGFFAIIHMISQRSYCFFQDRVNIPEQGPNGLPIPGPRCWFGLLTPGEGMFQKVWTMICVCYLLYYLYTLDTQVEAMAAGDNILLLVTTPKGVNPVRFQAQVFDRLNAMAEDIGLPLKLEETYTSNRYFEYGKASYYDGKKISLALKKASRIGTEMQETIPSLNARLSSVFSTGVSVAAEDTHPMPAYLVSLTEAILTIGDYIELDKVPEDTLTLMLLVTRSLGGLKVTNYASFCVRGIQDGATQNLDFLRGIHELKDDYPKLYSRLMSYPLVIKPVSFAALVRDPYNIPVSSLPDAESKIRRLIEDNLPGLIRNEDIKPLFSDVAGRIEKELINDLLQLRPPSLKLMSSIFQYSNIAQREKSISRFQSSTSVNNLICSNMSLAHLHNDAKQSDIQLLKRFLSKTRHNFIKDMNLDSCPTRLMTELRKRITGLDLQTPSGPPPTHQIFMKPWHETNISEIPFSIKVIVSDNAQQFLHNRGKLPIYLGSETKIKRAKTSLEMYSTDPLDRVVLSIAELSTWVGQDPHLQRLLDRLILEKTSSAPEDIKTTCRQIIGGSFEHRGHLMTLPTGAYCNYDPTIMSYIDIITDTAINYTKKHENYTIMFQLLKVTIGSKLLHMHFGGIDIRGEWAAIMGCSDCTQLIYDSDYSLAVQPIYTGLPLRMANHIMFINKDHGIVRGDPYEAGHAYLGHQLAKSVLDWEHIERVSETDNIDRGGLHSNSSIGLTELSRSNCTLLLTYSFLYLAANSVLWDMMRDQSYLVEVSSFSPMEYFMNTLIMAGHMMMPSVWMQETVFMKVMIMTWLILLL